MDKRFAAASLPIRHGGPALLVAAALLAGCTAAPTRRTLLPPPPDRSTPPPVAAVGPVPRPQPAPAPVTADPASPTALGFREYLIGAERSAIKTDGMNCTRSARTPWQETCVGVYHHASPAKITIAGAWINDFVLVFIGERLASIETMFDSRYFNRVVYSLGSRHGQPAKSQEVISGGYGVKVSAEKAIWEIPDGLIVVREMAGTPAYSSARFYSSATAAGAKR